MPEAAQPVAGSLAAVVRRACRVAECAHFGRADCPEHAWTEDLGVIASFDHRTQEMAHE